MSRRFEQGELFHSNSNLKFFIRICLSSVSILGFEIFSPISSDTLTLVEEILIVAGLSPCIVILRHM